MFFFCSLEVKALAAAGSLSSPRFRRSPAGHPPLHLAVAAIPPYLSAVGLVTRIADRPAGVRLCNDVRRDLVFDEGDAVAKLQLALFQPLQPQQIRCRRLMQGIDGGVEITVLLLQPCKLGLEFALVLVGHGVWLN